MRGASEPESTLAPTAPPLPPGGVRTLLAHEQRPPTKRWRVAYLVSHPIQYQAPLLRHLTTDSELDVCALFLSDVSIGNFRDPGFDREVEWDVDLLSGYEHRFLPAHGATDQLSPLRPRTRGIEGLFASGEFDALWVHGYAHQATLRAIAAAKRARIPVLMRGESLLQGRRTSGFGPWLRERLLPRILRRVDAFLAIGSANRDFYRAYGVTNDRIFDAPYVVDNDRFRAQALAARPQREALRAELELDPERPVVLFASKLSDRKRPLDAIEAVTRLGEAHPERAPYLLLVGDGPLRGDVQRAVEAAEARLGRPTFRRLGFINQTELPRYYDLSDVLTLPSTFEPWGLIVNEAMAAGRPVVVSDRVGSGFDLVEPGRTGEVHPAGDARGLQEALWRVLESRETARAYGERAAERIARHDFDAVARGITAALDACGGTR
ncbi:MAG: glycosyltransferase family 4 protein [Planctomycetota bacterium]